MYKQREDYMLDLIRLEVQKRMEEFFEYVYRRKEYNTEELKHIIDTHMIISYIGPYLTKEIDKLILEYAKEKYEEE